jgi:hypothetical protein
VIGEVSKMAITNEDEILSSAIAHFGENAQVLKCIEELAELIEALSITLDSRDDEDNYRLLYLERGARAIREYTRDITTVNLQRTKASYISEVVEELADVSITTSQMLKIFNCHEEVEKIKQQKLSRLAKRMNGCDSQ